MIRRQRAAIRLQRGFRAVLARIRRRELVIGELAALRHRAYHRGATLFQALWRGYWCRKHIHNFHARAAYLREVSAIGELKLAEMDRFKTEQLEAAAHRATAESRRRHELKVSQEHHLVSTKMISG